MQFNAMPCIGISDRYVNIQNVQFSIQFDSIDPPTFPFRFLKKSKRASGKTGLFPDQNTIVELQRKYMFAIRLVRLVHNLQLEGCLSVRTLLLGQNNTIIILKKKPSKIWFTTIKVE